MHKIFRGYICLLALILLVISCGKKESKAPEGVVKRIHQPKASIPPKPGEGAQAVMDRSFFQLPERNPFRTYIVQSAPEEVFEPKIPLQRYELSQLRLVAVVWGIPTPVGMIETPDGKGYTVKRGDLVGNKNGRVVSITENSIVIEEKRKGFVPGDIKVSRFTLSLPLPKE